MAAPDLRSQSRAWSGHEASQDMTLGRLTKETFTPTVGAARTRDYTFDPRGNLQGMPSHEVDTPNHTATPTDARRHDDANAVVRLRRQRQCQYLQGQQLAYDHDDHLTSQHPVAAPEQWVGQNDHILDDGTEVLLYVAN